MIRRRAAIFAATVLAGAAGAEAATSADCGALAKVRVAALTVRTAGLFAPEGQPPVCRVTGEVRTSATTSVRIEAWMPARGWNHRFLATGWAFYAGTMNPAILAGPAAKGYATVTTDGGGMPGPPAFFLSDPGKVKDWGERAWHVTTVTAKALVKAYYGAPAKSAYWNGGGGAARQGLKEVQRYPADYDGVAVGGLANDTSHFAFAQVAEWQAMHAGVPVRASILPLLHAAAVAACDRLDGAQDGLIGDPEACRFDPQGLVCRAGVRDECLTEGEADAFRRVYAPVRDPQTGKEIFGGLARGSELNWRSLIEDAAPQSYALDFFRYLVFADPTWDFHSLDYHRDLERAEAVDPSVNGVDADLRPFFARGGKLLIWGGWADNAIPPSANTAYFRAVLQRVGPAAKRSIRLFMVPGMAHFPGRSGPDAFDFDTQPLIEAWCEQGKRPEALAVAHWASGVKDRDFLVKSYEPTSRP